MQDDEFDILLEEFRHHQQTCIECATEKQIGLKADENYVDLSCSKGKEMLNRLINLALNPLRRV